MTTKAQHTPGPLVARFHNETWQVEFDGPDHRWVIAEVFGSSSKNQGEASANARLIAAAPDLLAACQALQDWFSDIRPVLQGCGACGRYDKHLLGCPVPLASAALAHFKGEA